MPTYQFVCQECAEPFERRLRMAQANENQKCPACGSACTRKRISAVALSGGIKLSGSQAAPALSNPFS